MLHWNLKGMQYPPIFKSSIKYGARGVMQHRYTLINDDVFYKYFCGLQTTLSFQKYS